MKFSELYLILAVKLQVLSNGVFNFVISPLGTPLILKILYIITFPTVRTRKIFLVKFQLFPKSCFARWQIKEPC